MKKIFSLAVGLLLAINISQADEKLDIEILKISKKAQKMLA